MVKPEEIPDHASYQWPNADMTCNITRMLRLVEVGLRHTARALELQTRGPRPIYSVSPQQEYYDGASMAAESESPSSRVESTFFGLLEEQQLALQQQAHLARR